MMTEQEFRSIMDDESIETEMDSAPNAIRGLAIIEKYCPGKGIAWAEQDVIGSVSVEEIVKNGITKEDTIKLALLNWMIGPDYDSDTLACFV